MKRLILGASLALAACTDVFSPKAPAAFLSGNAEPLVFTAAVSKTPVTAGDTASLIFTLKNPTAQRVTLNFPTGCQIVMRVRRGRDEVWPEPYTCFQALTQLRLDPGTERVVRLPFTAITGEELAIWTGLVLTPAAYVAYAELENGEGRSTSVDFVVVK